MLALLFILLPTAWACEIVVPARVLFTGADLNDAWPFPQQACEVPQLRAALDVLRDQHGEVPLARLQAALGDQVKVVSSDTVIHIESAASLVRAQYNPPADATLELSPVNLPALVALPATSETKFQCHPCRFEGGEVLRMDVRAYGEVPRSLEFQARFTRLVEAYRLTRPVPAYSGALSADMFKRVQVPQRAAGKFFHRLPSLSFYKTNKSLRAGDLLREEDLVPLTLVKAGERVELLFENSHVSVKSQAVSRQNGGIGQRVEVWNQANGRKHVATVVDQGKVVVEL